MSRIRKFVDEKLSNIKLKRDILSGKVKKTQKVSHWYMIYIAVVAENQVQEYLSSLKENKYIIDYCMVKDLLKDNSNNLNNNNNDKNVAKSLNYAFVKTCINKDIVSRITNFKYIQRFFPNNDSPYDIDDIENFIKSIKKEEDVKNEEGDDSNHSSIVGSSIIVKFGLFVGMNGFINTYNEKTNEIEVFLFYSNKNLASTNLKTILNINDVEIVKEK
ncbi:hypothetical protein AB837_00186 [bacterium AB1]|nr:hypothetical protein AB837_00186 [bacterium AB1]